MAHDFRGGISGRKWKIASSVIGVQTVLEEMCTWHWSGQAITLTDGTPHLALVLYRAMRDRWVDREK